MPTQSSVANVSDKKRHVLDALLKREGLERAAGDEIPRRQSNGPAPLSFAQKRLWTLDQIEPGIPLYNIQKSIRISGPLDVNALQCAFAEIVRRHDVLRTSFESQDGAPQQIVHAPQPPELELIDLSHHAAVEKSQAVEHANIAASRQRFLLDRGPLIRLTLLRLSADEHVALLTMHHIVSDGWSMRVLMDEILALYIAFASGHPSPLPDLALQYIDYTAWQHEMLRGGGAARQLDYWKRKLAGSPPKLEFPTDRPRPAVQTYEGAHEGFIIPQQLAADLRTLSQRSGATIYMVLLAAFQLFLSRHSGQTDIGVGSPFSGRTRRQLEPLIGLFVNTLVLQTFIDPGESFRELLAQVKEVVLEAQANQDVPFEQVVEALGVERTLSHTPLFQVMFALQNAPAGSKPSGNVRFEALSVENNMSKFELTLFITESESGLSGAFEYNTHLFDRETICRMSARFQHLLTSIVGSPSLPISRLSMIPEPESALVTRSWNETAADYPQDISIHQLFEQQAASQPDSLSVVFGDSCLTYAALNRASDRIAEALRSAGVRPGDYVAVLLDRSLEIVPALLGILRAGAAYVPLDMKWPRQRMRAVLDSLQIRYLTTRRELLPICEELSASGSQLDAAICLERDGAIEIERLGSSAPHTPSLNKPVGSEAIAYAIFTSGSTGTPKGVVVRHKRVVNLVHWANRNFSLTSHDRVLCVASLCFDLSVYDIFGLLAAGGVVQIASDDDIHDPEQLTRLLTEYPITFWDSAPAALQQLTPFLHKVPAASSESLRLVFLSGDWIPFSLPGQLRNTFRRAEVIALGGATEATVWSNFFRVPDNMDPHWVSIPYGRPIANARYYVLDDGLLPCPIGVPGDLFIGGECLADGYAKDPHQTAARFVPDPFSTNGDRLYRTGDRARFMPRGDIEFLGRKDHQVKVRGYRIELGEIETALQDHPAVREAVVQVREAAPGDKRLVGYIVTSNETPPAWTELHNWLRERLPEYMTPATWVPLIELPRSATGKIDRNALPVPVWGGTDQSINAELGNDTERTLARIWSEVLRVDRVGPHQNFFELGGDSILSIQIVARAQAAGLRVTAKQLFQHQTVAELAAVAEVDSAPAAAQGRVSGPVELTPIQHRFFDQNWTRPAHFNQAVLLEARAPVQEEGLRAVVRALVDHHDVLRTRFEFDGTRWKQEVLEDPAGDPVTVELVGSSQELEQRASEWQTRFDLGSGLLLRIVLFRMHDGGADRVLLIAHHLVVDGVSWRILLEDLDGGYQQWALGKPPEFPPKTASFQRWSELLTERAALEEVEAEWPYWEAQCTAPASLAEPGQPRQDERNETILVTLDEDNTAALLEEVPPVYGTQINDVLLTALSYAVDCDSELPLQLEGHGRDEEVGLDVFRTVGWFTVMYPIKLRFAREESLADRLQSVKDQLRSVPRGGLGYGLLRYLGRDRERSRNLTYHPRVSFNYLGRLDNALVQDGLLLPARERSGPARSPRVIPDQALRVSGFIAKGVLHMSISWSAHCHAKADVQAIADAYLESLRAIVHHCRNTAVAGYRPSDFPLADLDQQSLQNLISQVEF